MSPERSSSTRRLRVPRSRAWRRSRRGPPTATTTQKCPHGGIAIPRRHLLPRARPRTPPGSAAFLFVPQEPSLSRRYEVLVRSAPLDGGVIHPEQLGGAA